MNHFGTVKPSRTGRRHKATRAVMAALVGGSVLASCDTRIKDSVVGGAEQFVFGLLSPVNPDGLASLFLPDSGA